MKQLLLAAILLAGIFTVSAQSPNEEKPPKTDSIKPLTDSADLYGYIPERPIKVGGGPANQRKYLESLRDAKGKRISYERLGSCCEYPSSKGLFGYALLDKYEITYRDQSDKKQTAIVYISFYDYENPKAIKGFTMVD